jgi:predicted ATPase with chaperone activity
MNNEIDQSKADQFHEIRGQALAKRAVEVALAGNHKLLLAVTEYGVSREFISKIHATECAENSYAFRQAEMMAVALNITPKSAKQFMAMSKAKRSHLLLWSDMVTEVPAIPLDEMNRPTGEPFDRIWARVERARTVLAKTAAKPERHRYELDSAGTRLLRQVKESLNLPAIRVEQILRVSLTVAALDDSELIKPQHLAEAVQYGRTFLVP